MKIKYGVMAAALMAVACAMQAPGCGEASATEREIADCEWSVGGRHALSERAAGFAGGRRPTRRRELLPIMGTPRHRRLGALNKIQALLKEQGLDMKDVVKMTVFSWRAIQLRKISWIFPGLQAAYTQFFGTKDQPNKPARSAMQVAALAAPWALVEIEVIAVKSK